MRDADREVVGVIAMAGQAARLGVLPCSKELLPVGFEADAGGWPRPKVAAHYLLERMRLAGVRRAFLVLRKGKWDIPQYFGDGSALGMHLAYLIMGEPFGPPYSLDQAFPFVQDSLVAFGFPDILFHPVDTFRRLRERQAATQADAVLALMPAAGSREFDGVEVAPDGSVRRLVPRPAEPPLPYTWTCAIWTPRFTGFLREYLAVDRAARASPGAPVEQPDLPVGAVLQAAIAEKLRVEGVVAADGSYLDIGTPENLLRATRQLAGAASTPAGPDSHERTATW